MTKPEQESPRSQAPGTAQGTPAETSVPAEVDRRGVPLPARARVGGIITPQ